MTGDIDMELVLGFLLVLLFHLFEDVIGFAKPLVVTCFTYEDIEIAPEIFQSGTGIVQCCTLYPTMTCLEIGLKNTECSLPEISLSR